jgi:hypothetical protein
MNSYRSKNGAKGHRRILFAMACGASLLAWSGCAPASGEAIANSQAASEIRAKLLAKPASDASDSSQPEAGPVGFRSLAGQFVLGGMDRVEIKLLEANIKPEDRAVCAPEGHNPRDNSLLVDEATRGIADVVVFARKTKNKHESALEPEEPEVVFDQKECLFLSPVLVAQVGQTIQVKNSDPVGHNTNIQGTSFNQIIPVNQSAPFPVKSQIEAAKEVACNIHPWMKAYMWFRKDGYFAVTDAQGKFEIKNLPAGEEIEFQVWHARARGGVALNKPDLKWDAKGRFKLKLEPDSDSNMPSAHDLGTLEVPPGQLVGG